MILSISNSNKLLALPSCLNAIQVKFKSLNLSVLHQRNFMISHRTICCCFFKCMYITVMANCDGIFEIFISLLCSFTRIYSFITDFLS